MERIIHEEMRPNGEKLVAALSEYKGTTYVSLRVYYEDRATGEFRPGRNGINLPLSELPSLVTCFDRLTEDEEIEVVLDAAGARDVAEGEDD